MCVQVWYVQIEMKNKYVWWINNVNSVVCSMFNVKCSWDGLLGGRNCSCLWCAKTVNDEPNVFYRWKIWTAGQFSTQTLLLRSHAVEIAAVCGFALSCWNTRHLEGSICCSKTFIYLSAFIVPSKTCKLPIPYALMHPHTIRDAGFWTERW